jgi:hypothetical protein
MFGLGAKGSYITAARRAIEAARPTHVISCRKSFGLRRVRKLRSTAKMGENRHDANDNGLWFDNRQGIQSLRRDS